MRLLALIARRCLWMPPTLFGLLLIVFAVSHVIASDSAHVMAGENASVDQVAANLVRVVTVAGLTMAAFWLAILLQLLFSMWLGLTPVQGRTDGWGPDPITGFFTIDTVPRGDWDTLGQALRHLVLPAMILALPAVATIMRFAHAGMINCVGDLPRYPPAVVAAVARTLGTLPSWIAGVMPPILELLDRHAQFPIYSAWGRRSGWLRAASE